MALHIVVNNDIGAGIDPEKRYAAGIRRLIQQERVMISEVEGVVFIVRYGHLDARVFKNDEMGCGLINHIAAIDIREP